MIRPHPSIQNPILPMLLKNTNKPSDEINLVQMQQIMPQQHRAVYHHMDRNMVSNQGSPTSAQHNQTTPYNVFSRIQSQTMNNLNGPDSYSNVPDNAEDGQMTAWQDNNEDNRSHETDQAARLMANGEDRVKNNQELRHQINHNHSAYENRQVYNSQHQPQMSHKHPNYRPNRSKYPNIVGDGPLKATLVQSPQNQLHPIEYLASLKERLKNVHHFYKMRIEEQRQKIAERNEMFMGVIEEMESEFKARMMDDAQEMGNKSYSVSQNNRSQQHASRLLNTSKNQNVSQQSHANPSIQQLEKKFKSLNKMLENKLNQSPTVVIPPINLPNQHDNIDKLHYSLDGIINQITTLQQSIEQQQSLISEQQAANSKQKGLIKKLNDQLMEVRSEMETWERKIMKEKSRKKEIAEMIREAEQSLAN